jgi:hypothetical protein
VVWILGGNNDPNSVDDKNLSPGERRRRRARERYAEMSPVAKEALLKRLRDARASKRLFKTPQEVQESRRQVNIKNKRKRKEHRENNLHPDSIAMENPQWKPELLWPPGPKPTSRVSEEMVIPDFGGSPIYVEAEVREPPQQDETHETFLSNTIHTAHLTIGIWSLNQPLEETPMGSLVKMRTLRVCRHIRVLLTMVNYLPTYILL